MDEVMLMASNFLKLHLSFLVPLIESDASIILDKMSWENLGEYNKMNFVFLICTKLKPSSLSWGRYCTLISLTVMQLLVFLT